MEPDHSLLVALRMWSTRLKKILTAKWFTTGLHTVTFSPIIREERTNHATEKKSLAPKSENTSPIQPENTTKEQVTP